MKSPKIQITLIILQILAQAVFAQEPQQAVQQEPQQATQQEPQQAAQQEPQQATQQEPQQAVQQEPQQATQQEPQGPPVHTITVDFGPTIIGFAIGALPIGDDFDISGFGFAAQYEYQIFERLSVAGRFAYLGSSIERTEEQNGDNAKLKMDLSSFSLEAHPRVYPFGSSFFLDGMLGYADMSMKISGSVFTEDDFGNKNKESKSFSISRSYLKYGVKLGWRADFGEPGGFIFEHSYGWYNASGMGKTMGKQMSKRFDGDIPSEVDDAFEIFEDYVFVGGPRVTFAFGWKF
jgi:hypothetical protein